MIKLLQFIWELPQNIVGLIMLPFMKQSEIIEYGGRKIRICPNIISGISLGSFIYERLNIYNRVMHEYGHSKQSKLLGPLYLLIIGIPSIIWNTLIYGKLVERTPNGYYKFYTERWADKLGGVVR